MDRELPRHKISKFSSDKKAVPKLPLYSQVYLYPRDKKPKLRQKKRVRTKTESQVPSILLSKSRKASKKDLLESINLEEVLRNAYKEPEPSMSFFKKLRISSPSFMRSASILPGQLTKKKESQDVKSVNSTSETKSSSKTISRLKHRRKYV